MCSTCVYYVYVLHERVCNLSPKVDNAEILKDVIIQVAVVDLMVPSYSNFHTLFKH